MDEITITKKFYDKYAQHWIDTKTNSFIHEKPFATLMTVWPTKAQIIDIGCAAGIHVPLFLGIGHGLKYHGLDISKTFLKVATRRYPQLKFSLANIADRNTLPTGKYTGFLATAILMHIPFPDWDTTFENIERLVQPGSYGYVTLPIAHPSAEKADTDVRHFTILSAAEQIAYFKKRNWKIIKKGSLDGTSTAAVWHYYIIQLPQ